MTRDVLIAAFRAESSPKPLAVEADGITRYVRVMTAFDADATTKKLDALKKDDGCQTGRVLACTLCDAEGALLFDAANADDVLMLSKLPPKLQTRLITAANQAQGAESGNA